MPNTTCPDFSQAALAISGHSRHNRSETQWKAVVKTLSMFALSSLTRRPRSSKRLSMYADTSLTPRENERNMSDSHGEVIFYRIAIVFWFSRSQRRVALLSSTRWEYTAAVVYEGIRKALVVREPHAFIHSPECRWSPFWFSRTTKEEQSSSARILWVYARGKRLETRDYHIRA